jgi:UDP-N-acetylglucosamine 2-epimerase (non-hydrolysing)
VVGARPNFMKMAPVFKALEKYPVEQSIIHTGQHYSQNMSDIFFAELGIKPPEMNLQVGSGSHANQVAQIMIKFEEVMLKEKPDLILVYGDVNSTLAAALVGAKMGIKIGHIEAGLRSFDLSMPEEINRIVTDRLSSLFFIHSPEAEENLIKENVSAENIHFVGNVMIDTLLKYLKIIKQRKNITPPFPEFGIVTLHRPSNVDDPERLKNVILSFNRIAQRIPLIFPIHPRTKKQLELVKDAEFDPKNIALIDPLGYLDFLSLVYRSRLVITDSGGIQEETTHLGIPCLTLRSNTERPVTVTEGTSTLIGDDYELLEKTIDKILAGKYKQGKIPQNWDGQAAERIAKIIIKQFNE